MIKYRTETKTIKVPDSITCDRCNKDITDLSNDVIEFRHEFGFGSEVDGEFLEFDLCEACLNDTIVQMNIAVRKRTNSIDCWEGI